MWRDEYLNEIQAPSAFSGDHCNSKKDIDPTILNREKTLDLMSQFEDFVVVCRHKRQKQATPKESGSLPVKCTFYTFKIFSSE